MSRDTDATEGSEYGGLDWFLLAQMALQKVLEADISDPTAVRMLDVIAHLARLRQSVVEESGFLETVDTERSEFALNNSLALRQVDIRESLPCFEDGPDGGDLPEDTARELVMDLYRRFEDSWLRVRLVGERGYERTEGHFESNHHGVPTAVSVRYPLKTFQQQPLATAFRDALWNDGVAVVTRIDPRSADVDAGKMDEEHIQFHLTPVRLWRAGLLPDVTEPTDDE